MAITKAPQLEGIFNTDPDTHSMYIVANNYDDRYSSILETLADTGLDLQLAFVGVWKFTKLTMSQNSLVRVNMMSLLIDIIRLGVKNGSLYDRGNAKLHGEVANAIKSILDIRRTENYDREITNGYLNETHHNMYWMGVMDSLASIIYDVHLKSVAEVDGEWIVLLDDDEDGAGAMYHPRMNKYILIYDKDTDLMMTAHQTYDYGHIINTKLIGDELRKFLRVDHIISETKDSTIWSYWNNTISTFIDLYEMRFNIVTFDKIY